MRTCLGCSQMKPISEASEYLRRHFKWAVEAYGEAALCYCQVMEVIVRKDSQKTCGVNKNV